MVTPKWCMWTQGKEMLVGGTGLFLTQFPSEFKEDKEDVVWPQGPGPRVRVCFLVLAV